MQIEENSRKGKMRDLKKVGRIKGIFHSKMGTIMDRNSKDLTEAEEIKKRWQEYTEVLFKKELNDPANHDGAVTHLETDTLESEVKLALGKITVNKANEGDEISSELFKILKCATKEPHSICHQISETQQWPQDWKNQFSFQSQRREMLKNVQTPIQFLAFHILARLCSKSL